MFLFIVTYYDTDGFTYGCTNVLGAYKTRAEADERCLRYSEEHRLALENFDVINLDYGDWAL